MGYAARKKQALLESRRILERWVREDLQRIEQTARDRGAPDADGLFPVHPVLDRQMAEFMGNVAALRSLKGRG
jgi:hypothetical protein